MSKARKRRWRAFLIGSAAFTLAAVSQVGAAQERDLPVRDRTQTGVTITGREIVERLTRLEERVIRLEEGQKRLEQQIHDLQQFMLWGFGLTFTGMFALIGFVLWDRRTAVAPVTRRVTELEDEHRKFKEAMRELSKENPRSAEILRELGIL